MQSLVSFDFTAACTKPISTFIILKIFQLKYAVVRELQYTRNLVSQNTFQVGSISKPCFDFALIFFLLSTDRVIHPLDLVHVFDKSQMNQERNKKIKGNTSLWVFVISFERNTLKMNRTKKEIHYLNTPSQFRLCVIISNKDRNEKKDGIIQDKTEKRNFPNKCRGLTNSFL